MSNLKAGFVMIMALFLSLMLGFSGMVVAGGDKAGSVEARIKQKLTGAVERAEVTSIRKSAVKGMYQVELSSGEIVFVHESGDYLIHGDLFKVTSDGIDNETEKWRGKKRKTVIAALNKKDMIVFSGNKKPKGEIYVFTDVACGYCQKFHQEVPKLTEMGITVNYIAWPRAGAESAVGKTMANVWCADDRQGAMTLAKSRQAVPESAKSCTAQIKEQIAIGQQLGIRGTPAIFLADGEQVGGYRTADEFAEILGITKSGS